MSCACNVKGLLVLNGRVFMGGMGRDGPYLRPDGDHRPEIRLLGTVQLLA